MLATQNPIEQEGTYPLPEAQLDRFLLKVQMGYPEASEEAAMVRQVTTDTIGDALRVDGVRPLDGRSRECWNSSVWPLPCGWTMRCSTTRCGIVRATRQWPGIAIGAGPRGAIALVRVGPGPRPARGPRLRHAGRREVSGSARPPPPPAAQPRNGDRRPRLRRSPPGHPGQGAGPPRMIPTLRLLRLLGAWTLLGLAASIWARLLPWWAGFGLEPAPRLWPSISMLTLWPRD